MALAARIRSAVDISTVSFMALGVAVRVNSGRSSSVFLGSDWQIGGMIAVLSALSWEG